MSKVENFLSESGGDNFTNSAPRPPVPGEENELQSNGGMSTRSSGSHKSHLSSKSHASNKSVCSNRSDVNHSPAATPRRSNKDKTGTSFMGCSGTCLDDEDMCAPLGFEPEGSAANSPPFTENSTPPYLKWAENLNNLLDDSDGVQLFRKFLEDEGIGSSAIDFWFACQGLKKNPPEKISQIVKVILKKYIKSDKLPCISIDTKQSICDRVQRKLSDQTIFDSAQIEVESDMRNKIYPLFLDSDLYVQYVRKESESPKSSNTSSGSSSTRPLSGAQSGPLPTVVEDMELNSSDIKFSSTSWGPPPSGKHGISRTSDQSIRKSESVASTSYPHPFRTPLPPIPYVSICPTSAQDSEIASLSSDAMTDDTRSLTDSSSVDALPLRDSKQWIRYRKRVQRKHMQHNRETSFHPQFIPRTERAPKDRNIAEVDPQKFAELLTEKLNVVVQQREKNERVEESIRRMEASVEYSDKSFNTSGAKNVSSTSIMPLMTSSIIEEENPDSILEEHCSRVWEHSADHSPCRSVGGTPPKSKSPERTSKKGGTQSQSSAPQICNPKGPHHKKKQEHLSVLSFDSGMGEEKQPAIETHKHVHHHYHHHHTRERRSKERLELDAQNNIHRYGHVGVPEYSRDYERGRSTSKRSTNRKQCDNSSVIDSGVSGVSITDSLPPAPNVSDPSSEKVLSWMAQTDNIAANTSAYTDSDKSSSYKKHRPNVLLANTQQVHKQGTSKKSNSRSVNRSTSAERSLLSPWGMSASAGQVLPSQPFVQDSSMPLMNPPSITSQLEEARRRLEVQQTMPVKSFSFGGAPSKEKYMLPSSQSTTQMRPPPISVEQPADTSLPSSERKTSRKSSAGRGGKTVIGYYFCGEPIPYQTNTLASTVTLHQFKDLIIKRGNFRYFFKSPSHEFGTEYVYEEIHEDNAVLPVIDGKIVAKVEKIE